MEKSESSQTFFSYWGGDWHSNSQTQTIGCCAQTYTGVVPEAATHSSGIDCSSIVYMLAYGGGSAPAASVGEYPAWTLRKSVVIIKVHSYSLCFCSSFWSWICIWSMVSSWTI